MKLAFVSSPEMFKGIKSRLYIYKDENGKKYIYKEFIPPIGEKIENELIANKLAGLAGLNVLDFFESKTIPGRRSGILMDYIEAPTLADFKSSLSRKQKQDLRRIILFDTWTGNADRHTANILVTERMIAFDHTNLFKQSERAADFIKLDVGNRLNKEYVDKLGKLLQLKVTTEKALIEWFGFTKSDFDSIKNIKDEEIWKLVKGNKYSYLIRRKKKLSEFQFT